MRKPLCTALLLVVAGLAGRAEPAAAMASHHGWPPYDGMLLMNERDSNRPLEARVGFPAFGGPDHMQGCKDTTNRPSRSCKPWFRSSGNGGFVIAPSTVHNRLYGGHGDDDIHGGDNGDVIWGDYKPTNQSTTQHDALAGGAGTDFIYTSHGTNLVSAGAGDDVIHAKYGHGAVDCGPGRDIIYVDKQHRNAYKRVNCEVVIAKTGESAPPFILRRLPWPITDTQQRR